MSVVSLQPQRLPAEDGGGDTLSLDEKGRGRHRPVKHSVETPDVLQATAHPYEGFSQDVQGTGKPLAEKLSCGCQPPEDNGPQQAHAQQQQQPQPEQQAQPQQQQRNGQSKHNVHRRLEDHKHLLHFDYLHEKEMEGKAGLSPSPAPSTYLQDEILPDFSPLLEDDKVHVLRRERQKQYREELQQQLRQRRCQARSRYAAAAAPAPAPSHAKAPTSPSAYERQLRMEQMAEMRANLQAQKKREIERLRRIYRNDERKLTAHLLRLRLQQGDGDSGAARIRPVTPASPSQSGPPLPPAPAPAPAPAQSLHDDPERLDKNSKAPCHEAAGSPSRHRQAADAKRKEQQTAHRTSKPLTFKQAFLRLQQQRRAEQTLLEESRAKAAAWKADAERRERLQRDVRNYADWRTSYSLAGVPLTAVAPAQERRFQNAASWLDKQRAAQQEKRVERDRQLCSWKKEKDRQIRERRLKEQAEQKVAKEVQEARKKEAGDCFQRWLHEIRARKAAQMVAGPRGTIGVSSYSSAFSLPAPWREPPNKVWRATGNADTRSTRRYQDVTQNVLS